VSEKTVIRSAGAIAVRHERTGDAARVFEIQERAFGRAAEAVLVDALRERARPVISFVAESRGQIVGHVLFSPVTVGQGAGARAAMGLAPLAVDPVHQGLGVGSALARAGLEACRSAGHLVVVVLGSPAYYGRFGFEPATLHGLSYPGPADPAFQVVSLEPGALAGFAGVAHYHPAFDEIEGMS